MADITKILLRRDTEANWQLAQDSSELPLLSLGEPAIAIDNNGNIIGFKIGDGIHKWEDLTYLSGDFNAIANRVRDLEIEFATLNEEINGTEQADGLKQILQALNAEVNNAETGLGAVRTQVNTNTGDIALNSQAIGGIARGLGDVEQGLRDEASARSDEDERLEDLIDTEALDRQNAINNLRTELEGEISPITEEITTINGKFMEGTTSSNPAAHKDFVNSSIATNTATFRGTFNVVTDLSLTELATEEEVIEALNDYFEREEIVPENNDYCFVAFPDPTARDQFTKYSRYKYTVEVVEEVETGDWAWEFDLNNSSFTAAQWDSITSGINSEDVTQLREGLIPYLTTEPESDNSNYGMIQIVILDHEPLTRYSGYFYIITEPQL